MPKRFLPSLEGLSVHNRGNTPHWEIPDACYSITYRLHDSLPLHTIAELHDARLKLERDAVTAAERLESRRAWQADVDTHLDRGHGACYLRDPRVAALIAKNFHHFDGSRYELMAWCIMPNHVHVVMRALGAQSLATILHSWKSYTSLRANAVLGRTGVFWQTEYYDRIIRDAEDLENTIAYVVNNPWKAGLKQWPWVWKAGEPLVA